METRGNICLLVDALGSGGAERAAANLSMALSGKGFSVFICTMRADISYPFKGTLFNFGRIKKEQGNPLRALKTFKAYFKRNNFDTIIDFRVRRNFFKEWIFSGYVFAGKKVIYTVHSADLSYYFSCRSIPVLARIPHVSRRRFVVVSTAIKEHLKNKLSAPSLVIRNIANHKAINALSKEACNVPEPYIIAVGRLNKVKQFDVLINSYARSCLPEKNIKLVIIGSGPERESLNRLITGHKLFEKVSIKPFQTNPYPLIRKSLFLTMSSKNEGLPMVLIEAILLGVPMVAFNCISGPSELIVPDKNGILVRNQDEHALTEALNTMVNDTDFYLRCKQNTLKLPDEFDEEYIVQQWIDLITNF